MSIGWALIGVFLSAAVFRMLIDAGRMFDEKRKLANVRRMRIVEDLPPSFREEMKARGWAVKS